MASMHLVGSAKINTSSGRLHLSHSKQAARREHLKHRCIQNSGCDATEDFVRNAFARERVLKQKDAVISEHEFGIFSPILRVGSYCSSDS